MDSLVRKGPSSIPAIGCTAGDELLYVANYPPEDTKMRVRQRRRQCGGLTATALVAAARMGARCVYAGTLGHDDLSRFVEQQLSDQGIDLQYLRRQPGAKPVHSTIVVDEARGSRTIFYDLDGAGEAAADWPAEEVIRAAKVLFVDPFGIEGMIRAARIATAAGIPVVMVDSDGDIHEIIPFWLDAGVSIMHPMEVAAGMDVVFLGKQFGKRIGFFGGIDCPIRA